MMKEEEDFLVPMGTCFCPNFCDHFLGQRVFIWEKNLAHKNLVALLKSFSDFT